MLQQQQNSEYFSEKPRQTSEFLKRKISMGGWKDDTNEGQDLNLLKRLQNNLNRYETENKKVLKQSVSYKSNKIIKLPRLLNSSTSNKQIKKQRNTSGQAKMKSSLPVKMKIMGLDQNSLSDSQKRVKEKSPSIDKYRSKVVVKVERTKKINQNFNIFSDAKFFQDGHISNFVKSKMLA